MLGWDTEWTLVGGRRVIVGRIVLDALIRVEENRLVAMKLAAKYISGLTHDSTGRLQLEPGTRGEFSADASGMEVRFSTGQRLVVPWSDVRELEVRGPDQPEKLPSSRRHVAR